MINKSLAILFLIIFHALAQQQVAQPVVTQLVVTQLVATQPKVTIVMVIDQFAAHYIPKLDAYLSGGIHKLLKHGVVYTNATYPYAALETAVGHASLGTGALPGGEQKTAHGIIANSWLTPDGVDHVFTGNTVHEIRVAPFTKRFLQANSHNKAAALSLKDRAAIGLVGNSAPALWFDKKQGNFVVNKFDPVINEVLKNAYECIRVPRQTHWQLAHVDERYYKFPFIDNYEYASEPSLFLPQSHAQTVTSREKFLEVFLKMPEANKLLLDMTRLYIERAYKTLGADGALLVWVSLSSLDKIGHIYGPFSREVIDMIYHLDKQIGSFMDAIAKTVAPKNTLYVLTADHGVMPIPELIKAQFPEARRIMVSDLVDEVNSYIKKKFKITDVIRGHKTPHVYLDQKKLSKVSPGRRELIIETIRTKLGEYPGIRYVYDAEKLVKASVPEGSMAWLFKNNVYPGRSGDLLLQIAPHAIASKYMSGTKHYTPYAYNTHVPLIFYQAETHEKNIVTQHVWVNQLTATLAWLFGINQTKFPFVPLPGIEL